LLTAYARAILPSDKEFYRHVISKLGQKGFTVETKQ
jgi:hypothetical protein